MMIRKYAKVFIKHVTKKNYRHLLRIELNRRAMLENFSIIKSHNPNFSIIPVLKGNAYGHGIKEVAQILNGADCDFIAVDGYFEAAMISDITKHRILVMGYIHPINTKYLDTKKCSYVVQDVGSLLAFGKLGKKVNIHLELNTGMNRLGLAPNEVQEYLDSFQKFPNLHLEGIMTHLADADNPTNPSFSKLQLRQFDKQVGKIISAGFNPKYIHISQTAGSVKIKNKFANAVRIGIGLYGINPLQANDKYYSKFSALRPVLELKAAIIKVIEINKGDKVSYNGTFIAPKKMKIGVLPLGYYEGVPRELSNKGFVTGGSACLPILGRICMNHMNISLENADLNLFDEVTVISNDSKCKNSVEAMQNEYNLFSYSTLTSLSSSIRRTII